MNAPWRILGTTDERDVCELCGKSGLKKVVVLTDGEVENYVGTCCAATLVHRSAAYVGKKAASVESARVKEARSAEWSSIVAARHYQFLRNAVTSVPPSREKFNLGLRKVCEQTGLSEQTVLRHLGARWGLGGK